jgi:hypothetical protein
MIEVWYMVVLYLVLYFIGMKLAVTTNKWYMEITGFALNGWALLQLMGY